jgi:hypothetical protein
MMKVLLYHTYALRKVLFLLRPKNFSNHFSALQYIRNAHTHFLLLNFIIQQVDNLKLYEP